MPYLQSQPIKYGVAHIPIPRIFITKPERFFLIFMDRRAKGKPFEKPGLSNIYKQERETMAREAKYREEDTHGDVWKGIHRADCYVELGLSLFNTGLKVAQVKNADGDVALVDEMYHEIKHHIADAKKGLVRAVNCVRCKNGLHSR